MNDYHSDQMKKVAIVILNYKNCRDTIECLESIQQIDYPDYQIIVVDNNSEDDSVSRIEDWANGKFMFESDFVKYDKKLKPLRCIKYIRKTAENGGIEEYENQLKEYPANRKLVLILTDENLGFSGGNNVGVRYALKKNADAILIVNPDVRIESHDTLTKMLDTMFSYDNIFIVGPNVLDREGKRQSPLREPTFLEECLNPFLFAIIKRVSKRRVGYLEPIHADNPFEVNKVAGCCFMIRSSFLIDIGLLDERVFLYCEEPILAAQVAKNGGKLFFMPDVTVKHLHRRPSNKHLKEFFKSRLYYLRKYKKYNKFKLSIISMIYKLISILVKRRNIN